MNHFSKTHNCAIKIINNSQKQDQRIKKEEETKLKRSRQDEAKILIREFLNHRQQQVEELRTQNQVIKNEIEANAPVETLVD